MPWVTNFHQPPPEVAACLLPGSQTTLQSFREVDTPGLHLNNSTDACPSTTVLMLAHQCANLLLYNFLPF